MNVGGAKCSWAHITKTAKQIFSHTHTHARTQRMKAKDETRNKPMRTCIWSNCTNTHPFDLLYIRNISFLCKICSVPHFRFCSYFLPLSLSIPLLFCKCVISQFDAFFRMYFFLVFCFETRIFFISPSALSYARIFVFVKRKPRTWFPHTVISSTVPPITLVHTHTPNRPSFLFSRFPFSLSTIMNEFCVCSTLSYS